MWNFHIATSALEAALHDDTRIAAYRRISLLLLTLRCLCSVHPMDDRMIAWWPFVIYNITLHDNYTKSCLSFHVRRMSSCATASIGLLLYDTVGRLVGWLEFNVPFQHKYGPISQTNDTVHMRDIRLCAI